MLPSEFLSRVSYPEFVLLQTAYRLNPWGERRADYRSALQSQNFVSCFASKPVKVQDCLLEFSKPKLLSYKEGVEMFAAWAKHQVKHKPTKPSPNPSP